jgi:hypothetical protein
VRDVVADGRRVRSYWDTCASHNFVSTRFAAELISRGARYQRTELPILQGVIHAGVCRLIILVDLDIVHQGRIIRLNDEQFWVWDMGAELTFSNVLLEEEGLLPASPGLQDEQLLSQFVCRGGEFEAGEDESTLLLHLQERSNYARERLVNPASLRHVAQLGPDIPKELVSQEAQEDLVRRFASSVAGETSKAHLDAFSLEKILEVRRLLLKQLSTPDAECLKRLEEIKANYPEAFGEDISKPCTLRKFEIRLKSGFKFYCFLPRRVSDPVLKQMREQIEALLKMGIVEECRDSPFAFPIVMAKRPGSDKLRLCIDYKFQNMQTEPYPYPIPDIRDQLSRLAGKKFYCSLDCSSFFHEFEVLEECRPYTAFVTPWGQKLQWKRVPFGLRNSPSHCQREFQELLAKSGNPALQDIVPYFDDVAFGADSVEELCEKFEALLAIAVKNGLRFKESKCVLGTRAIPHLGFVVNSEGIHLAPSRVDQLLKISAAKDVSDVRYILGAFGFCRAWLADSATISAPLTDLLRKDVAWQWGPRQQRALDQLKAAVCTAPCLQGAIDSLYPVYGRTDASILGVAAVLFQMLPTGDLDENGQPILQPKAIGYAARRFSPTEFRWTLNQKEGYSLKFFFEKFGDIVQGHQVHLQTDHRNSLFMNNSVCPKVVRWRLYMNRWDHLISHLRGVDNSCADGLSRKLDGHTEDELQEELSRLHIWNLKQVAPTDAEARIQRDDIQGDDEDCDDDVCAMFNSLLASTVELDDRAYRKHNSSSFSSNFTQTGEDKPVWFTLAAKSHAVCNPVAGSDLDVAAVAEVDQIEFDQIESLIDQGEEDVDLGVNISNDPRPAQPSQPTEQFTLLPLLRQVHSDIAGHVGAMKMYRRLRLLQDVNWDLPASAIMAEISKFIAACPICQKSSTAPTVPQSNRWIRQPPFREISIDVLEMPTPDSDGNNKILVVLDSFSRAVEFFPLPTADAERVAECLYAVYCRYYRVAVVRSDNAKAFLGSVVTLLLKLLGAQGHHVSAFAHWQNGQVERAHREVMRHLRVLIMGDAAGVNSVVKWSTLLHGARRICMNTVNSSTGVTPNDLVYGGFADSDESLFQEPVQKPSSAASADAFVFELQSEQMKMVARAEEYQQKRFEFIISRTSDEGDQSLHDGDWVLCYRGGLPHGRPRTKLQLPWTGPWKVVDREDDPLNPRVRCIHAASRKVETFGRRELRVFNADLMDGPDDFVKSAQRDEWDYNVDCILNHRPDGPRRLPSGGLRRKDAYQFNVRYKFLPLSDEAGSENPSWQPYNNLRFTEALYRYCQLPTVARQLGSDFCPAAPE